MTTHAVAAQTSHQAGGSVIRVARLSKTYSARVVDSVDWHAEHGRVHALLGGNGSGKSTLLKMLAGVVTPDAGGTIEVGGATHPSEHYSPSLAAAAGLRFVHQDLGLIDELSIADNFGLAGGYSRTPWGTIDKKQLIARTEAQLRRSGLPHDPRMPVAALRPTERALVAISRALDGIEDGSATLILDEPTASLPVDEVEHLFASIRELRDAGHSVVFVSHRLSEVSAIADDVTVIRDGQVVGSGALADFDEQRIVELIAGHAVVSSHVSRPALDPDRTAALSVRGLNAGPVADVTFDIAPGEIVGVAGLMGSGRSSLLRALFGDLPATGEILIDGRPTAIGSTVDAVRAGIALVPEDRLRDAAFLDRPVWENLFAAVVSSYRRGPWLSSRGERADAPAVMSEFSVRAPSAAVPLAALSGGNQQKVVMARWMRSEPRILLLDEPTQGVDAIAREEIHGFVRAAADRGCAVLVVSSDIDELAALADRALVLQRGRLDRQLRGDEMTRDVLAAAIQDAPAAESTITPGRGPIPQQGARP